MLQFKTRMLNDITQHVEFLEDSITPQLTMMLLTREMEEVEENGRFYTHPLYQPSTKPWSKLKNFKFPKTQQAYFTPIQKYLKNHAKLINIIKINKFCHKIKKEMWYSFFILNTIPSPYAYAYELMQVCWMHP